MGNHCIDVVCTGCGRCFCLRGCGGETKPNRKYAEKARRALTVGKTYSYGKKCCADCVCDSALGLKEEDLIVSEVMLL